MIISLLDWCRRLLQESSCPGVGGEGSISPRCGLGAREAVVPHKLLCREMGGSAVRKALARACSRKRARDPNMTSGLEAQWRQ